MSQNEPERNAEMQNSKDPGLEGESVKRKRSEGSSLSECDTSRDSLDLNQKDSSKNRKKKTRKLAKICEINNDSGDLESKRKTSEYEKQHEMVEIKKQLSEINAKLSNVIKKDDGSIRQVIKEVFSEMKEDLLKSVSKKVEVLESRLFDKERENDNLKYKIGELEKDLKEQTNENDTLREEVFASRKKMDKIANESEQYCRRNNLRISGLPQKLEKETADQTTTLVCKTLNEKLESSKIEITSKDIDIAHRIGKMKNGKRQIIVRFQSRLVRDKIFRNKKTLKGTGIFLSEDLTQLNNLVLSCVRDKSPDEVEAAWTHNGKILYKSKMGEIREVRFGDFQDWIDMSWPTTARQNFDTRQTQKSKDQTQKKNVWESTKN